jgi:hypothetical protein
VLWDDRPQQGEVLVRQFDGQRFIVLIQGTAADHVGDMIATSRCSLLVFST